MLPAGVVGLLAGVALHAGAPVAAFWVLTASALVAPYLLLLHRRVGAAWCLVVAAAALGCGRAAVVEIPPAGPAGERLGTRWVRGRIMGLRTGAWAGGGRWARLEVHLDRVRDGPGPAAGDGLRLSIRESRVAWELGDVVEGWLPVRGARGFCNAGEDEWARWLRSRGILWTAWRATDADLSRAGGGAADALAVRGAIGRAIDGAVSGDAAAVLRALVLGDRSRIHPALRERFARSGTAHLLAVSGVHLAIVAGGTFAALSPGLAWCALPFGVTAVRGGALLGALAMAALYVALTGGAIATQRALVMVVFSGLAVIARRPASAARALAAAAMVLIVLEPTVVDDLSFQLSFSAVVGLLAAARRLPGTLLARVTTTDDSASRRARAWIVGGMASSFAAAAATAPLVARTFGEVSLVGVVANLAIAPVLGVGALATGILGAVLAVVVPGVGHRLLWLSGLLVEGAIAMARWFSAMPFATVAPPRPSGVVILAWFAAVAALGLEAATKRRAVWGVCVVAVAAAYAAPIDRPPFRVSFLDVGQGDAATVVASTGDAWVVDGGGLGGTFDPGERILVPALEALSIDRLRAIVSSHGDRDHFGGLRAVAQSVSAASFWWNGLPSSSRDFAALLASLERRDVERRVAADGAHLASDPIEWRALHPPSGDAQSLSKNDASLVVAARFGATRVLFAGDVEARAERSLWRRGADVSATIAKVPHHGSRTSSTPRWVRSVRPAVAVASLGAFNRFGFPAPSVVARHREAGARWLTTGARGEITVVSDGQLEEVRTCRAS